MSNYLFSDLEHLQQLVLGCLRLHLFDLFKSFCAFLGMLQTDVAVLATIIESRHKHAINYHHKELKKRVLSLQFSGMRDKGVSMCFHLIV